VSFSIPTPPAPVLPTAPAAPPQFGAPTQGQKPQAKNSQPTYLGGLLTPQSNQQGGKTLLGQ
jgi:hypothetical protein